MSGIILLLSWQTIIDVAVVVVALFCLIAIVCISLLALQVYGLVKDVRVELRTLSGQAQDAVKSVQGTTEFVTAGVAKPVIQVVSIAAGLARTASILRGGIFHPRHPSPKDSE